MKFVGHQDLIRLFHRTFRRIGITLDHSKGFHPHPKLRFSPPLALGIESSAEYLDFDTINQGLKVTDILQVLLVNLPTGIEPYELSEAPLNDPPVSAKIQQVTYKLEFPDFWKKPRNGAKSASIPVVLPVSTLQCCAKAKSEMWI